MNNNLSAASIPNVLTLGKPVNQSIVGSPQPVGGQQTLMPNVQIVNMRPGTATVPVQKSVATVSPRVVIGAPQVVAPRPAAPGITLQGLPGIQAGQQGHLLLKTENGQYQLLRVGPAPPTSTLTAQAPQTLRLSTVPAVSRQTTILPARPLLTTNQTTILPARPLLTANVFQATTNIAPAPTLVQQVALPGGVAAPMVGSVVPAVPAVAAPMMAPVCNLVTNARQAAPTPLAPTPLAQTPLAPALLTPAQQKIADNTKEKCRNFLANLLDLSSKEPKSVEISVKTLIQELIDAKVEPEEFCNRLERLLNASPQPCLIGFLKKSLPLLRQSLVVKELIIEGINAPPVHVAYPFCSDQITSIIDPRNNVAPPVQNTAKPNTISVLQNVAIQPPKPAALGKVSSSSPGKASKGVAVVLSGNASRGLIIREKEKKIQAYTATFTDIDKMAGDDDINDVAAMGGVNLAEESQKILGSTEMIGTQIRSCKDEYLVQPSVMQAYTKKITTQHGLEEITPELCNVLSHGLQEVLKNIMENLVNTALDRIQTDKMKENDVFENVTDLKGQLSFLEEIDHIQMKKAKQLRMQIDMDIEMKDEQGTSDTDKDDEEERPSKRRKLDNEELPVKSNNIESSKSLDDSNSGPLEAAHNDFLNTHKLEPPVMETSDISDLPTESGTAQDLDESNDSESAKVSESLIDMKIQDTAVSSTNMETSRNDEAPRSLNTAEEDFANDNIHYPTDADLQANVVTLRDAQFLLDNDRTYYHILYKAYISKGLKRYYI